MGLAWLVFCAIGATATNSCEDATSGSTCYKNIAWARETGMSSHPGWYDKYPISVESSVPEWQCVLYSIQMKTPTSAEETDPYPTLSHDCAYPCTPSMMCPEWGIDES